MKYVALLALGLLVVPVAAQTFPTTTTLPAVLPDGAGGCVPGTPLTLSIPVSGVTGATSVDVNFLFSPAHTWHGDIQLDLTSPSGQTVTLMEAGCQGSLDDSSNVDGPYTLSDSAATSFDDAAFAAGTSIPAGTYAPDNSAGGALLCGNPNGTWTATFIDHFIGDTGTLSAFSLTFTTAPPGESFTICQAGPGAPVCLFHLGGPAGGTYFNPALLNTPSAVPNGWAFGLDIPWAVFLDEATNSAYGNLFTGTLDAGGNSVVCVPGVPAGFTIQTVGVHIDPATGLPVFASDPVSYTVI